MITGASVTPSTKEEGAGQTVNIRRWSECLLLIGSNQDTSAFSDLYDHYAPRLNGYLIKKGASPALAEELSQEALLAVWKKASSYQANIASPNTWIFTIARNLFIDYYRRKSSKDMETLEQYHLEDFYQDDCDNESEITISAMNRDVTGQHIRDALRDLPFLQAQIVFKSYYEGKSHTAISNDMDLALGTVKSNLRLAFQKLRTCFGDA